MIEVLRRSGVYNQLKRKYPADDPRVLDARRELLTERLLVHIHNVLADAPALTDEQAQQITAVLTRR